MLVFIIMLAGAPLEVYLNADTANARLVVLGAGYSIAHANLMETTLISAGGRIYGSPFNVAPAI